MSAIDDLMATLTPQGPMPAVMSSQLPQFTPPPITNPHQNLLQRVVGNLGGLLGGAAGGISDAIRPSAPGGYDGLLSEDEIKNARPGLLRSLIRAPDAPSATDQYQLNLNHLVELKQLAAGIGERKRILATRAAMPTLFPTPDNESLDQTRTRLGKMYAYALQNGDEETVKDVGSRLSTLFSAPRDSALALEDAKVKAGQAAYLAKQKADYNTLKASFPDHPLSKMPFDPTNPADYTAGLADARDLRKITAAGSREHWVAAGLDPTGQPVMINTMTGETKVGGGIKAAAGAGTNPSMSAAKTNLESAKKTMDDFESKLMSGKATYGPFDAMKGAVGSAEAAQTAKGILGPLESFTANAAGGSLRSGNSDLAEYLKAKKFVAEAILNTHKRPNQTQYEIEQELSGIGSLNDQSQWQTPAMRQLIAQSKERRDRMYSEVFGGAGSPSKGSGSEKGSSLDAYRHLLK